MKKLLIAAGLALACTACTPALETGGGLDPAPPANVEDCSASAPTDQRTLCLAFEAFDGVLYAVDALRDVGVLEPGTPWALRVQKGIVETQAALNDASAIQRGLRTGDYLAALARAQSALERVSAALKDRR